jgi:hypothetical protein
MRSATKYSSRPEPWQLATHRSVVALATALAVVTMIGCGRPAHQLETAAVRGQVTLDGQPLPSGYVVVPTARGRMASGKIQPDGTFVLSTYEEGDGAQVGTHPIVVNEVPPDEFSSVPAQDRVPIPARYASAGSSGLQVIVKPGEENVLELKLTTNP